jgi:hypothetical protein
MEDSGFTKSDTVTDKMKVNLNMLCPLMLYRIGAQIHGADIITIHYSGPGRWMVKLM